MKILHIITSLGDGGAEHTLFKICKGDVSYEHVVISLKGPGKYYLKLKKLGVEVYFLNLNFYSVNKFFYLIKLIRSIKPKIIQTWLVHADLIGSFAAKLSGVKNIVWNIRYSNLALGKANLVTIFLISILKKLSLFYSKIDNYKL